MLTNDGTALPMIASISTLDRNHSRFYSLMRARMHAHIRSVRARVRASRRACTRACVRKHALTHSRRNEQVHTHACLPECPHMHARARTHKRMKSRSHTNACMRACALACRSDTCDARFWYRLWAGPFIARLAQLAERKALNLVVVGSSPTSGGLFAKEHICLRVNLAKRCDILIFTCIFFWRPPFVSSLMN